MPPQTTRMAPLNTQGSAGLRQTKLRPIGFSPSDEVYKPYDKMSKKERDTDREKFWDSMPVWYKKAYNDSLGGMMHEMMTGNKYYDLKNAPPNQVQDFVAMVLSFFASKEDWAVMGAGAGLGGAVAKTGMKQALKVGMSKSLGREFVVKETSDAVLRKRVAAQITRGTNLNYKTAKIIVDDVVQQGLPQMAILGLHDGLYKSATRTRDAMVKSGNTIELMTGKEFDKNGGFLGGTWTNKENFGLKAYALKEVLRNSKLKDYAKGSAMGLTGGTARALRALPGKAVSSLEKRGSRVRAGAVKGVDKLIGGERSSGLFYETMTFSALAGPVYEGRAPEWTDIVTGVALAGAISTPGRAISYGKGKINHKLKFEFSDFETREMTALAAEAERFGNHINYSLLNPAVKGSKGPVIKGINQTVKEGLKESGQKPPKEAIGKRRVSVIQDSISQDAKGNITMKVKVGKGDGKQAGILELDARNTKKFFDYYVERPNQYRKDYGSLIGKRKGDITKFDKVRNDKVIQVLEKNSKEGKNGYKQQDWDEAIKYLASMKEKGTNAAQFKKIAKMIKEGKEVTSKDMNDATKAVMARYVDDAKYIREFVNKNSSIYNVTRLFNPVGLLNKDKSLLSRVLTVFKPAYSQLDSRYAKMALRMLDEVSIGAQNKTMKRFSMLDDIVGMGDPSLVGKKTGLWWKKYLTEGAAWDDLNKINQLDRLNNNTKGRDTILKKWKKELNNPNLSKAEKDKLKLKIEFLPKIKKFTDEIYDDAKGVGINVADYVESYVPFMFKKDVLDVLFDGQKLIDEKIMEIAGNIRVDKSYKPEMIKKLNKEIEDLVKTFDKKLKRKGNAKGDDFKSLFNKLMETRADGTKPDAYDAYATMALGLENFTRKQFAPLEKSRKLGNTGIDTGTFTRMALENNDYLYEKNILSLFQNYTAGATKRIEMARAFTPEYKLLDSLKNKIGDAPMQGFLASIPGYSAKTEKEAIGLAIDVFTGDINFQKQTNLSKWLQSVNNLEMFTKIASGFAPIVNITQTLISSMVISPYASVKSMINLAKDIRVGKGKDKSGIREWNRGSGSTLRTVMEELMVTDPYLQLGASSLGASKFGESPTQALIRDILTGGREYTISNILKPTSKERQQSFKTGIDFIRDAADLLQANKSVAFRRGVARVTQFGAKWSGFNKINEVNQLIASATAEQLIINWAKILTGKKVGLGFLDTAAPELRKKWALNSLKRFGFSEKEILRNSKSIIDRNYNVNNIGLKQKVQRSMVRFALDTQMQRSFTKDPFFFNDPNFKAMFLFKRFGYRQAVFMKEEMEREVVQGNIMPILQLGMAGLAGGPAVMWAREKYAALITGEEQYYGENNRRKMLEQPDWQDFLSGLANVGAFGMLTDLTNEEDPGRVVGRFLTPVQWDDMQRVIRAGVEVQKNIALYPNMKDVAWRRGINKLLPILGGIPGRTLKRGIETEAMTKDRVRGNRRRVVEHARKLIEQGNTKEAIEVVNTFNLVFAEKDIERGAFAQAFGLREKTYPGYPSLRITYADFSVPIMQRRYYKSLIRESKEKTYIP